MKQTDAVDANRVFLASIVVSQVYLILAYEFGIQDAMLRQFLMQVAMVLPCVIYLVRRNVSLRDSIGLMPLGGMQWLLLLPLAVCVNRIAEYLNLVSQLFTENQVSNHMAELVLQYPFPIAFFVIAVAPAVCEELIYRGALYHRYRKNGVCLAVLLSGFLFGIMHMNLNQFCYGFVVGALFALINEAAGSFLPGVFLHMFINGRSVVLSYVLMNDSERLGEQYMEAEEVGASLLTLLPYVLVAVCGTTLILWYFFRHRGKMAGGFSLPVREEGEEKKRTWLQQVVSPSLLIGCFICIWFMFAE